MLGNISMNWSDKVLSIGDFTFKLDFINGVIYKIFLAAIVFIVVLFVIKIGNKLIDKIVQKQIETNSRFSMDEKKASTFGSLCKSILKYTIYVLGLMSIASIFMKVDLPLTVVSSMAGVAVGFGAQSFVKDVINGVFVLFENQYAIGDYVTIDKYTGIVESIGLRSTMLRDFSGDHHIIPNGSVNIVTNHTKGNVQIKVEVEVAYEESIDNAIEVIRRACSKFSKDNENLVTEPNVIGVTAFKKSGMNIKIVGEVIPMTQWVEEAKLRKIIKEELDEAGIEIPYNKFNIVNQNQNI